MGRIFVCALLFTSVAAAQGDRVGPEMTREKMWPAPTAADWKKPCLITWQRTWKDAEAVSRLTGKPILVCINMDGEIASEHWAGIRYRQAEVAKLYEPYVTVVASTYRHNPRDYDDEGKRIPCPRFGGVTCGEHIWIEPIIFEKFCDGQRVAPRHICVDLKGNEVYDVYYKNDTASVVDAIRDDVPDTGEPPKTVVRGDRPIVERVGSRDVRDRTAVEQAYAKGDAELRRKLLEAAMQHREKGQLDLLRLAVFGLDAERSREARAALAQTQDSGATELISEAMRVPMSPDERDALIATLKRLGGDSPLARWLAGVHKGLAAKSTAVDATGWKPLRGGGQYAAPKLTFGGLARLGHVEDSTRAAEERPQDPAARLALAEATLSLALKAPETYATNPRMASLAARHLYNDARRLGREAQELGATGWRVHAVQALAAYYGGEREAAYPHAEAAVKALPPGDTGWNSMAVLTVFAEARWKAIKKAVKAKEDYPAEWLSDLHSAYSILLRHPLGTEGQVLWHYELMVWLRAYRRATAVLREGLVRYPGSERLHGKLRDRLLLFRGADALEEGYAALVKEHDTPERLAPFAGVASVVAAESNRRRWRYEEAVASYGRAIEYFERAPRNDAVDHAIARALAGRARVHYQLDDDASAHRDILASFARRPLSAGSRDGMGITPGETAQMLLARLQKNEQADLAAQLDAALQKIDPELLKPDVGLTGR